MRPIDADDLKEVWLRYCIKHMQNKKRKILKDHTEEMYRDGCFAIDSRPTISPEPNWIPCSEQKPQPRCIEYLADGSFPRIRLCRCGFYTLSTEEHGRFYVDAEIVSMFESAMGKGRATRRNGKRNFIESLYQNRIIAWMPLPEPYGGESDGKN